MSRAEPPPWSVPVAIHDVPETGRRFELAADDNARKAVAKAIGVRALPRLEAGFEVTRNGREGLRVVGNVTARVGQTCVLTLEPIENLVEEQVDLVFAPQSTTPAIDETGSARRRVAADEGPEALVGGVIDLGVLATEFVILGIDPYPRKSGAIFEAPAIGDGGGHPFAALAALKKGQGGQ